MTTDPAPGLPGLLPLEGVVRHYDWGSRTFLAALRSRSGATATTSAEPEAELWFGAHPSAPSVVRLGARDVALDTLIRQRPAELLGEAGARERAELPFLLKILAAEQPLSVQLHPDAPRARAGFAREEAAGIARDSPHRLFPDPNAKPEIACALTPFQALQGLRPPAEARALLASLACSETDALLARSAPEDPVALLETVLALDADRAVALAREAATAARRTPSAEAAWVVRLAEHFPEDPLVVAPLLLGLVELLPGDALYTPPGVIHSYLGGAVVELMGSSDNVLRAGLTSKHVDPEELLAALDRTPVGNRILSPSEAAGDAWRQYAGTAPLRLDFADLEPGVGLDVAAGRAPCILLAISGQVRAHSEDGCELELLAGRAALVPACAPGYRLDGAGRVYRASADPA
jgi:mannose-6-phosphate isomerase